jgi:hypothetical protein
MPHPAANVDAPEIDRSYIFAGRFILNLVLL